MYITDDGIEYDTKAECNKHNALMQWYEDYDGVAIRDSVRALDMLCWLEDNKALVQKLYKILVD